MVQIIFVRIYTDIPNLYLLMHLGRFSDRRSLKLDSYSAEGAAQQHGQAGVQQAAAAGVGVGGSMGARQAMVRGNSNGSSRKLAWIERER